MIRECQVRITTLASGDRRVHMPSAPPEKSTLYPLLWAVEMPDDTAVVSRV